MLILFTAYLDDGLPLLMSIARAEQKGPLSPLAHEVTAVIESCVNHVV